MTLSLKHVSWIRESEYILKDINWEVRNGEHWAIVGLNGSGKTTLLNIINGFIWPTKGEVSVLGHTFGQVDLRDLRKSIGWVSSSLQEKLYANETGLDIVVSGKFATIGLFDKPDQADYEQAAELLEKLGCPHLQNRPYRNCSQGEKQKLLIARALISSPKLLILDEASNGLDIFSREQLLSTVEHIALQPDAPTLLYVTHHIEEILPVFSHTLLLRNGEVYSAGKTTEVLTDNSLSHFFQSAIDVQWRAGRPWLQLKEHRPDVVTSPGKK